MPENLHRSMWAEMKPDIYSGKSCEQHKPQWETSADGDRESSTVDIIQLDSETFPPGTKVVVSEPFCPNCLMVPQRSTDRDTFKSDQGEDVTEYRWSCECDFDWRKFANSEYS